MLYLFTAVSIMKGKWSVLYISVIRQTVGYQTPAFTLPFSWRLHFTITCNLLHLRLICWRCHNNSVNTRSHLPIISDVKTRKKQNVVGIDMIRNKRIVICCFSTKYTTLRRKSNDWLAQNQNNVSEWGRHVYPRNVVSVI